MRVLAIETSTHHAGLAVVDHQGVVAERLLLAPMRHLEWILPGLERMLEEAALDSQALEGIAVSMGPGSFTGLRIGIATAAALAKGWGIPVVGVSTLDAVAAAIPRDGLVCAFLDAKRGEVAAALYRGWRGMCTRVTSDWVAPIATILERLEGYDEEIAFIGDGLGKFGEAVLDKLGDRAWLAPPIYWVPRAAMVGWIGRGLFIRGVKSDPYRLQPIYVRRPAFTPKNSDECSVTSD